MTYVSRVKAAECDLLIARARALQSEGRLQDAIATYESVLQAMPEHPGALRQLGILNFQLGRRDHSLHWFEAAVRARPQAGEAHADLARIHEALGRHHEALASADRALAIDSGNPEVHFIRAGLLAATGRHEAALQSYDRAIQLRGDYAEAHNNRGLALAALARYEEALESYQRALDVRPNYARALNNRGVALAALSRHAEAVASYERAIEAQTGYFASMSNRGDSLSALGRYREALESYERALIVKPDFAEATSGRARVLGLLNRTQECRAAWNRALACWDAVLASAPATPRTLLARGQCLGALGKHVEALASFESAVRARPDDPAALSNRGCALATLGRHDEALDSFDRSLAIGQPGPDTWRNRAASLHALGRLEEALESLQQALALASQDPVTLNNMGFTLHVLCRHDEALKCFERALALRPGFVAALTNRGDVLRVLDLADEALACYEHALQLDPDSHAALEGCGLLYAVCNRSDEARTCFERAVRAATDANESPSRIAKTRARELLACAASCFWDGLPDRVARVVRDIRDGHALDPFISVCFADEPADQLKCAVQFAAEGHRASPAPLWKGERYRHDRIRVAYLSADFHDHATAHLAAGLFENHDRSQFEITGLSFGPDQGPSAMRQRLERAFDRFIDVRQRSDAEVARLVRDLEIDIAVDLKGFTRGFRIGIFAQRPAPVQVNYLGYPGTLGVDYIDYIMADETLIPAEHRIHYKEAIAYLPDSYQITDDRRVMAESPGTRADWGLPENAFVFCSFNNSYKLTPAIFDVWMQLLREIEGSVLWLLQRDPAVRDNLHREAQARGVAADRILFAQSVRPEVHLARQRHADLFLDSLPVNAHTTASDALWGGLPIVTCLGTTFAGRVCASVLRAAGLEELITHSLAEYEGLAKQLARDPARLAALRAKVARAARESALFDTSRTRRHIEAAYVRMLELHEGGAPPRTFSVPAG